MQGFHMRSAQVWAAVFLVALGANAGPRQDERSGTAPPPQHTMGTKRTVKGIPHFGQVTPNLYRGAQPSAEGIAELKKMGVEVVVNLRGGGSKSEESAAEKL